MSVQTKMDNLAVKFLSPEDINVAASVLYQAYHDDPLLKHVLQAKHEASFEKKAQSANTRGTISIWSHRPTFSRIIQPS